MIRTIFVALHTDEIVVYEMHDRLTVNDAEMMMERVSKLMAR